MSPYVTILLSVAMLLLAACAQPRGGAGSELRAPYVEDVAAMETDDAAIGETAARPGADLPATPHWPPTGDVIAGLPAGGAALDAGDAGLPAGDPVLRQSVAERCTSRPDGVTEGSLLRALVADLQADGVDPAQAVDALIIGRCGDLAEIVTEMVALHGAEAATAIIDRAVVLTGDASALVVERAATKGLLRAGRERAALGGGVLPSMAPGDGDYALVYFPLRSDAGASERGATSVEELVGNAQPGYGIYTYILHGVGGDAAGGDAQRLATHRELLRVIETYVLAAGPDGGGPVALAHTFLVPVHAGRADAALEQRSSPDLSAAMRLRLAEYLRRAGQPALAVRLATAPGPFLVSSLEPRFVPGSLQAPRMIVDLSAIGPEYLYSVVDAYDRAIAAEAAGRAESLHAVRGRLIGMFPDRTIDPSAAAPPAGEDWVFMLGSPALSRPTGPGLHTRVAGVRLATIQSGR